MAAKKKEADQPTQAKATDYGNEELACYHVKRLATLKSGAENFRNRWEDCANYVKPRKGNILTFKEPGTDQTINRWDSTGEESADIASAGLLSSLMPAGQPWLRLDPKNKDAGAQVKEWLSKAGETIVEFLHGSNFYLGAHECLIDGVVFGTLNQCIEEDEVDGVNFTAVPCGTYYIAENARGRIDTVYRTWKWSVGQMVEKWGEENMCKAVKDIIRDAKTNPSAMDQLREILHVSMPRKKNTYKEGKVVGKLRPWLSLYIDVQAKHVIVEDGNYENPYVVARLEKSNDEIYGRSPAMATMPELKMLNTMREDVLLEMEKQVRPPWLMPADSAYLPDNRPDGITYWDPSRPENKPEQLNRTGRIDYAKDEMIEQRQRIRNAFWVQMFQMFSNPDEAKREKTAFEVSEMAREKLVLFSPVFARLTTEYLTPLIERVFNILLRNAVIPPPPAGIETSGGYSVVYISRIALAIKAAQNGSLATMMSLLQGTVQFDPSTALVIDWRKATRAIATNVGLPQEWQRSDEEIDKIVAAQQAQAAAAQQAETMEKMAGTVQKLGPAAQTQASEQIAKAAQGAPSQTGGKRLT